MTPYEFRADLDRANRAFCARRRLFVLGIGFMAAATLAAAWFLSQWRFF